MSYRGHNQVERLEGNRPEHWFAFVCGHCNVHNSGAIVAINKDPHGDVSKWVICTKCGEGSVITKHGVVMPGSLAGPILHGLPDRVKNAYQQARKSFSVGAFTGCEAICRKILMHVAVEKGAPEDQSFAIYVGYLESKGFVTPPMKSWVELIRKNGGGANHELEEPDQKRAEATLMFTAELLRLTYEMEHLAKSYAPSSVATV